MRYFIRKSHHFIAFRRFLKLVPAEETQCVFSHFIHNNPNITGSSWGDCAALLLPLKPTHSVDTSLSPVVMSSGDASEQSRRVSVLSWDQVRRLDSILGESVPIHGRGNFPTLSVQPRQIVQVGYQRTNLFLILTHLCTSV